MMVQDTLRSKHLSKVLKCLKKKRVSKRQFVFTVQCCLFAFSFSMFIIPSSIWVKTLNCLIHSEDHTIRNICTQIQLDAGYFNCIKNSHLTE